MIVSIPHGRLARSDVIRTCENVCLRPQLPPRDKARSNSPPTCAAARCARSGGAASRRTTVRVLRVLVKAIRLIAKAALRLMRARKPTSPNHLELGRILKVQDVTSSGGKGGHGRREDRVGRGVRRHRPRGRRPDPQHDPHRARQAGHARQRPRRALRSGDQGAQSCRLAQLGAFPRRFQVQIGPR